MVKDIDEGLLWDEPDDDGHGNGEHVPDICENKHRGNERSRKAYGQAEDVQQNMRRVRNIIRTLGQATYHDVMDEAERCGWHKLARPQTTSARLSNCKDAGWIIVAEKVKGPEGTACSRYVLAPDGYVVQKVHRPKTDRKLDPDRPLSRMQAAIADYVRRFGKYGRTVFELGEGNLDAVPWKTGKRSHPQLASAVAILERRGVLVDTGRERPNIYGNGCGVRVHIDFAERDTDGLDKDSDGPGPRSEGGQDGDSAEPTT